MENHSKENGLDEVLNNCKFKNYHPERNGEADLTNRGRENSYKTNHQDIVLDNELVDMKNDSKETVNTFKDIIENELVDMKNDSKETVNTFKDIIENNGLKDTPNKLVIGYDNDLVPDVNSPDSDDLFDSCKKVSSLSFSNNINHSKSIVNNVNTKGASVVHRPSDNNIHISNQPSVIQKKQSVSEENLFLSQTNNNSVEKSPCKHDVSNGNLSDIVEKVNSLNSNMSPKVVFHTPQTTPMKLKLNSLPVQSHPLDQHAFEQEDNQYVNEPLDFPNSPVLNKSMDEMCLRRYKRSSGPSISPNPLCDPVGETPRVIKQDTEMNCLRTSPATSRPHATASSRPAADSADFTNNVSAASYLKKYDDINAQVRAYLNKTSGVATSGDQGKSELEALNERTHRYLNTHSGSSMQEELSGGQKVQYASDDEDTSIYDTIVSQDCDGVKLVKNPRKPTSLPVTGGNKKKLLLTTDLFSGNLLEDDLQSLSEQDLDELLTPSNADDDLENSILEQLPLSEDEVESLQELTAREEREESRRWRVCVVNGTEKRIDMKVIEPYKRVLSHGGYLSADCHNAIIVFSACFLPHHSRADYHYVMDNLFFYVLYTLDQLITEDYVLVYLHGATSRHNMPTFSWLKRCYQMIDRKLKKNLKQLYLVHATFWLKTIILMSKPFISAKFSKKIQFILSLNELGEKLPIEDASIPEKVKQYDKIKLSMNSSQQHQ